MANYLLDTNHAAALVTLSHPLRQRVLPRFQAGDTFAVTVPVLAETLFGIGLLPRAAQNLAEWARLRRQGWQLETIDGFVAVTALRYNLVLLTADKDFVPVPGLKQDHHQHQGRPGPAERPAANRPQLTGRFETQRRPACWRRIFR